MAIILKQSTAHTFQLGPFIDETDGKTAEASLTIGDTDCFLSKAGGAFAAKNDTTDLTGSGDARGYYDCVLNATDTNTPGGLRVHVHVAGALPVFQDFQIVPAQVYESLVQGSEFLETSPYKQVMSISTGTLTARKTDGTTTQFTRTLTTNAAAEPITAVAT